MQSTDSIADMLTRIRNASTANHETVDVPMSKVRKAIADILLAEGYIAKVESLEDGVQGKMRLTLRYVGKKPVIAGLRRISRPGLRIYAKATELPKVLGGLGIAIVSTPQGIMTDKEARHKNVGGEVIAYIW